MRVPRVLVYGLLISAAAALLTLLAGEALWLAIVAFGSGALVVFTIALLSEGAEPVVVGTVPWLGAERRALLMPSSRLKLGSLALLLASVLGLFALIIVMVLVPYWMESWPHTIAIALTVAFALAAAVPITSLALRPGYIAVLGDGLLVRRGLVQHFVPWAAVSDIRVVTKEFGDAAGSESLRVTGHTRDLVHSNWLGRVWRRVQMDRGLTIPLVGLRVASDEVVLTVLKAWQDPGIVAKSGPIDTGQPALAPLQVITDGLRMVVDDLADFAIFHADKSRNRYAQVVRDGNGQLRAEAVSNAYLAEGSQLDAHQRDRLTGLGWQTPLAQDDNFSMKLRATSAEEVKQAAAALLFTLHEVYDLPTGQTPDVEIG